MQIVLINYDPSKMHYGYFYHYEPHYNPNSVSVRSLHVWSVSWTSGGGWTLDFSDCPTEPPVEGGLGPWAFQKVQPTLCEGGVVDLGLLKRSIPVRWGGVATK